MKQLPMTPELSAMIQKAVGQDVATDKLAVFETIALNTKPLPGKDGTIFEAAVVQPVTLVQMVDHINAGNHLPLIADHELFGAPKGRFFHAGLDYVDGQLEMRALFYLDETETETIAKINAGSLDEVSVSFLSTSFQCSECGWDYFQFADENNYDTRTCANGHTIGRNGVHANLVGLKKFVELSVVARGAADKPKIVGKSQSKLAPETPRLLMAHGYQPEAFMLRASINAKEEVTMDPTKLMTDLTDEIRKTATLTAEKTGLETQLTAVTGERDTARARVGELETELAAAKDAKPEGFDAAVADQTAALAYLGKQFDHLTVASGKAKVEGDARPKTVGEFTAKIDELTGNLTSIIPVGGKGEGLGGASDKDDKHSVNLSAAFGVKK